MPHLSKILVPVDFSPPSHSAVLEASVLAWHYQAELTLLHVNEVSHLLTSAGRLKSGDGGWEAVLSAHTASSEAVLEKFAAADLNGIPVRRVMREGDPAREIVAFAHEENVGLILMPTHGYGAVRRRLLGSVAAKVLHDAACPVWTAVHDFKPVENGPGVWRRLICGVRFGPESPNAVKWAVDFATEFQAELIVAHAIPLPPPESLYVQKWQDEAKRNARERIAHLISGLRVKPTIAILEGPPAEALGEAARDYNAELMVIGRDCSPGLIGRLSSEAYDIIRCAPCGVVSV